jgi:regulator of sigma E protease
MPQLLSILHTIFVMAIVLGFMILIHEFGHYAAAKYFGVRVEVFSIGFGKRLLGFKRGETDYRIAAIPLGGYVKMSGENPMDSRSDDPGEFLNHPRWQRFIIALAGPAMNIMLAVALLTGVYMMHYEYPAVLDEPAVIGWVNPDSPAERGGIKVGDKIVQVEDIQNPTWEQVTIKEALSPNQPLKYEIEHDGKITEKTLIPEPEGRNQLGTMGWVPKDSNVILTLVEPGMPAEKAGIKVGDQVLTANGQPIPVVQALIQMLKRTKDQPLDLAVLRNGQKLNFTVQPTFDQGASGQEPAYRIGIASASTKKVVQLNFTDALKRSLSENKNSSFLIL